MKTTTFFVLALLSFSSINAQTLNDKGQYIDNEGDLFNGTVSKSQDGIKSEFEVKDGLITGAATYYYASGKVMEKGTFASGKKDQKWIRYSESGSVSAIAFYALGKKTGTWMVYDDKGTKRFEMNYNDGQKSGLWTSWDENGSVIESKDYAKVN